MRWAARSLGSKVLRIGTPDPALMLWGTVEYETWSIDLAAFVKVHSASAHSTGTDKIEHMVQFMKFGCSLIIC